jgi:hypothetical protein
MGLMEQKTAGEFDWNPFIGRALAYVCLHFADLRERTRLEQADFLMALGLPRSEAASVLGTSDESLRVMANQRARREKEAGGKKTVKEVT